MSACLAWIGAGGMPDDSREPGWGHRNGSGAGIKAGTCGHRWAGGWTPRATIQDTPIPMHTQIYFGKPEVTYGADGKK